MYKTKGIQNTQKALDSILGKKTKQSLEKALENVITPDFITQDASVYALAYVMMETYSEQLPQLVENRRVIHEKMMDDAANLEKRYGVSDLDVRGFFDKAHVLSTGWSETRYFNKNAIGYNTAKKEIEDLKRLKDAMNTGLDKQYFNTARTKALQAKEEENEKLVKEFESCEKIFNELSKKYRASMGSPLVIPYLIWHKDEDLVKVVVPFGTKQEDNYFLRILHDKVNKVFKDTIDSVHRHVREDGDFVSVYTLEGKNVKTLMNDIASELELLSYETKTIIGNKAKIRILKETHL